MAKTRSTKRTRTVYETHFGTVPVDNCGRVYEIHHTDGNWRNDSPSNLVALSIEEHYDIHFKQGDYRACTLIGKKMNISKDQISHLASLSAKKQVKEGVHNFLGGAIQSSTNKRRVADGSHQFLGGQIVRDTNKKRIENGTHHFLIDHPNKKISVCPHCNKSGGAAIMKRWHFENCKVTKTSG